MSSDEEDRAISDDEDEIRAGSDGEGNLSPAEDAVDLVEELEHVVQPVEQNNGEVENENEDNDNQEDDEEKKKKEAKVKRVRNPQPKLDVERLRGPRGLRMLEKVFENVKFKGKGHEEGDLTVLMKNYEYWCHRLFPKFPFDDCLERMEKLGHKRYLQTYVKKIRMNLVDDEPVHPEQDVVDEETVENNENHQDEDDVFESLLPTRTTQNTQSDNVSDSNTLTEDQLRRIQMNREKAQKLRQQMLLNKQKTADENLSVLSVNHNMEVDEHIMNQSQDSDVDSDDIANNSFQLLTVQADIETNSSRNKADNNVISSRNSGIFNTSVEDKKLPKRIDVRQDEITSEINEQASSTIQMDEISSENQNSNNAEVNECDIVSQRKSNICNILENIDFDKDSNVENSLMQTETTSEIVGDNSIQNIVSETVEEPRQAVDSSDITADETLTVSDVNKDHCDAITNCENISTDTSNQKTNDKELNEDELVDFMNEDFDDSLIQNGLNKGNLLDKSAINKSGQEDTNRNEDNLAMDVDP